jgi:hypothetical protein
LLLLRPRLQGVVFSVLQTLVLYMPL